ncbi:hypothetical protein D3C71_1549060 [compost metagenome]
MFKPCARCSPRPCTSGRKISRPANRCPRFTMPNSAACLIALMVSLPALAKPMTLAFDAWACSRKDEKSGVFIGALTLPITLPPEAFTTSEVSRSSAWPNA